MLVYQRLQEEGSKSPSTCLDQCVESEVLGRHPDTNILLPLLDCLVLPWALDVEIGDDGTEGRDESVHLAMGHEGEGGAAEVRELESDFPGRHVSHKPVL